MRIFFAFSTGAMIGRILAKLLKRKNVDITDRNEYAKISTNNPDELKLAQELVEKNGVFDRFISDTMLNGTDASYKNQFANWLWVALADSNEIFDTYIESFDENGIKSDSHEVTAFIDRVNDFSVHSKKHADFKQQCREILNKITAKPDHIQIPDFSQQMQVMNENWNAKKKYVVNDDTVNESWTKIERNEISVDGDWGDFRAYRIPSWIDLMQTCHKTEWCVAQKGNNGETYYRHYGEPYYLVCDSKRSPFALLNPPSRQFKDVRDNAIRIRNNGKVLPTHRRAILFGKALLDKVSPHSRLTYDFECFSNENIAKIMKMDEEDRNDKTDYDGIVDSMPEEVIKKEVDNEFLKLINSEGGGYSWETHDKFKEMSEQERNAVIDDVLSGPKTQFIKGFMLDDLVRRGEKDRIVALMDRNTMVNDHRETTIASELLDKMQYAFSYTGEELDTFSAFDSMDDIVRRVLLAIPSGERNRMYAIRYVLGSDKCSKELLAEAMKEIDIMKLEPEGFRFILKSIENGRLDQSLFTKIEEHVVSHMEEMDNAGGGLVRILEDIVKSPLCSEKSREQVYESYRDSWNDGPAIEAVKASTGKTADDIFSLIENGTLTREYVENTRDSRKIAAALMNPRCPERLVQKVLDAVEYGSGYVISKYDCNMIYEALLNCGKLTQEQFMKMLKTNPKIVVKWGWNSPYCDDVVKLALAKKIGKQNGQIFNFNKDENPLVMQEFFKSRLIAGRYTDYIDAVRKGIVPDEVLRFALLRIDSSKSQAGIAMERTCHSKQLSEESIRFATEHIEEARYPRGISEELYRREDVPDDVIINGVLGKAGELYSNALVCYVHTHEKPQFRKVIEAIAEYVYEKGYQDDSTLGMLKHSIIHNPNCPDKYIKEVYEEKRKTDSDIVEHAIRSGMFSVDKICSDLSEMESGYYMDYSGIMDAILGSSLYTPEQKTAMVVRLNFDKISGSMLKELAAQCTGKSMFKKIVLSLSHRNEERGRALAMNNNYSQEQISQILNRNYGVVDGYYSRFGVDDKVIRSKHLYRLIENHFSDFTKEDKKTILHCDNIDAVWLMKQCIRQEQKVKKGVVNAARLNRISIRVALKERIDRMALKVAAGFRVSE